MKNRILSRIFLILTLLTLAVCVATPILVFTGTVTFSNYLIIFNIASLAYFLTAPVSLSK